MEPNQEDAGPVTLSPTDNNNNFSEKKEEFLVNIKKTIDQCEELWTILSSELQACNELMIKQIYVSERFSDFHEIWRSIDFNQDIEGLLLYREIDTEVFRLSAVLDTFEAKAHKTSEILRGMTMTLAANLRELNELRIKCDNSTTVEELDSFEIPDLAGIENTPYPDLSEVNEQWNKVNIYSKLNRCIEALESLTF